MTPPKKSKKKRGRVRKWKMWAVIDCQWNTIREIQSLRSLLRKQDCKDCKIIQVSIGPLIRKRRRAGK